MASDEGLQQLIGAALIDDQVFAALFENPLALADQFGLSVPERRFIAGVRPRDLEHFAALVERWSNPTPPRQKVVARRPATTQRVG
jgi:hypothetical protein